MEERKLRAIPAAMILTMNCPEDYMKVVGYPPILEENAKVMLDRTML